MKVELVKSILLIVMVVISLLLTFGLWTFQTNKDDYQGQNFQESVDIGGQEVNITKPEVIKPSSIIFHTNDNHYGLSEPEDLQNLYEDIKSWSLYDFQVTQENMKLVEGKEVEIVFPAAFPMELLSNMFNFEEVKSLTFPVWSFNRVVISFNQNSILKLHFLSEDGADQATAIVKNPGKYEKLLSYFTNKDRLFEYVLFDKGKQPIYIPLNEVSLNKRQFTVTTIEPIKMVEVLFPETALFSKSDNYYNDGIRGMNVLNNGQSISFLNSAFVEYERMKASEILSFSLKNINDHKGWTDTYRLVNIDQRDNLIRYRMYYEGYPTFSNINASIIEQQWRKNGDLYEYYRPLINLKSVLDSEVKTLRSGAEVIAYLERSVSDEKDFKAIQNIKLGFQYTYNEISSYAVLEPAWFLNINGVWQPIDFETKKGGALDAMESN
ncbi:YycH family regulatory protein [Virgibacillus sp. DJP39]|uniref:YycH family regulatory protein n=1 Tax=Virgibacillus sp. DJP39 TaxID=3409790 RepID=UPI003BB73EB7